MKNRRILIISGTSDIQRVARVSLKITAGWEVLAASSAYQGLALAATAQPDAILLDVILPDTDEVTALQKLQTNTLTRRIPVILMAPRVRLTDQHQFSQLGAAAVIAKPFDSVNLAQQIARALDWHLPSGDR